MPENITPLINSNTRVWIIEGRARPDHATSFYNFMRTEGLEKNWGSENPVYQPDPRRLKKFVEVESYSDEESRPTTSLVGHYPREIKSKMLELGERGCAYDVQVHMGQCEDPSIFADFQKALIFEAVKSESYSSDALGTLTPGDQAEVMETTEISFARAYEFIWPSFATRNPDVITNEIIAVAICDSQSCGDCQDESTGCKKIFAISKAAGGSPSTPADVIFSLDGGLTWAAHDIDTLGVAEDPNDVGCIGGYLVVLSEASGSIHYALLSEFENSGDPVFAEVTTGVVAGGEPRAISVTGQKAYIAGAGGYLYTMSSNPSAGLTAIDAGVATIVDYNDIHALDSEFAVAVGNDGAITKISNDIASLLATSPYGIGTHINAVFVKSTTEWFIGASNGTMYYTLNGGVTWTAISLPGTVTNITDIQMSSESVMYVSGVFTYAGTARGSIWISLCGGYEFTRMSKDTGIIPESDRVNAIAVCEYDVDFVVGVGLAGDGSDGFIVVGSD